MNFLQSQNQDSSREIKSPKRNIFLFFALVVFGLAIGYVGFAIGGIIRIVLILLGYTCIIAGVMQIIGVSECVCPDCESEGYIFKYAKNYKCKKCKSISVVVRKDNS